LPGPRRATAWALAVTAPLAVTVALAPARASLGLAGALLRALLSVVGVALLGGIRPALLAAGVSFLTVDHLYAPLLHSFKIDRLVDLIALITFVVLAAAVGGLVDLLTRQGVQVAALTSKRPTSPGWPLSCRARSGSYQARSGRRRGPRRAGVRRLVPGRLGTGRHGGVCGGPAVRVGGRRPDCDRRRRLRVHAAQAAIPPALPRQRRFWVRLRAALRRVEHRADGDAGGAGRHEHPPGWR